MRVRSRGVFGEAVAPSAPWTSIVATDAAGSGLGVILKGKRGCTSGRGSAASASSCVGAVGTLGAAGSGDGAEGCCVAARLRAGSCGDDSSSAMGKGGSNADVGAGGAGAPSFGE